MAVITQSYRTKVKRCSTSSDFSCAQTHRERMAPENTQNYRPSVKRYNTPLCSLHGKSNKGIAPAVSNGPISAMMTKSLDGIGKPQMMTKSVVGRALAAALLRRPDSPRRQTRHKKFKSPPEKFKPRPSRLIVMSGAPDGARSLVSELPLPVPVCRGNSSR